MAGAKDKPVLEHKGVRIYHVWKGRQAQSYWYALAPNAQAETGDVPNFDVRSLPPKYTAGLLIEDTGPVTNSDEQAKKYSAQLVAHKEALRRAIDDEHDFLARGVKGKISMIAKALFGKS